MAKVIYLTLNGQCSAVMMGSDKHVYSPMGTSPAPYGLYYYFFPITFFPEFFENVGNNNAA